MSYKLPFYKDTYTRRLLQPTLLTMTVILKGKEIKAIIKVQIKLFKHTRQTEREIWVKKLWCNLEIQKTYFSLSRSVETKNIQPIWGSGQNLFYPKRLKSVYKTMARWRWDRPKFNGRITYFSTWWLSKITLLKIVTCKKHWLENCRPQTTILFWVGLKGIYHAGAILVFIHAKAVSKVAALAMAAAVAKGIALGLQCFNACSRDDQAIAGCC